MPLWKHASKWMTAIGVLPDLSSSFEKGNPAYSQEPTCLDFLLFLTDGMQTVLFIFSFFLGFPKLRVELVGKGAWREQKSVWRYIERTSLLGKESACFS